MRISKTVVLLMSTMMAFSIVYGQEEKEPDFFYEVKREIKHPGYFSVEINPLQFGYKNYFLHLGAGAGARLSNFKNKYSAELKADFVYVNYSTDNNKLGYRSIDTDNKKFLNFEGNVGYTFLQNKKNETRTVRLKAKGNTEIVSDLPCDKITSFIVRGGFMSNSFHQRGEAESVDPNGSNNGISFAGGSYYEIFQTVNTVNIGIMRKTSVDTDFKTSKYGLVNETSDFEFYADILINIGNKFPQVNRLYYTDSNNPNEITNEIIMNYEDQNYVRSQFFKLPVGLRIGARQNGYKKTSFFWCGELGLYPGSYSNITSAASLKIGVGFRFQNNFN